jgi:uncharacterized protein
MMSNNTSSSVLVGRRLLLHILILSLLLPATRSCRSCFFHPTNYVLSHPVTTPRLPQLEPSPGGVDGGHNQSYNIHHHQGTRIRPISSSSGGGDEEIFGFPPYLLWHQQRPSKSLPRVRWTPIATSANLSAVAATLVVGATQGGRTKSVIAARSNYDDILLLRRQPQHAQPKLRRRKRRALGMLFSGDRDAESDEENSDEEDEEGESDGFCTSSSHNPASDDDNNDEQRPLEVQVDESNYNSDESEEDVEGEGVTTTTTPPSQRPQSVSSLMIGTIGVYKNFISPLLPPACRFVPTCSQYGVQAIEQFGPCRGVVLTAWRILRCSPLGGKGYDPPRWPPVHYTYSSY